MKKSITMHIVAWLCVVRINTTPLINICIGRYTHAINSSFSKASSRAKIKSIRCLLQEICRKLKRDESVCCCLLLRCQNLTEFMPDGNVWTLHMIVQISVEAIWRWNCKKWHLDPKLWSFFDRVNIVTQKNVYFQSIISEYWNVLWHLYKLYTSVR
jgi:hypothetical protein